MTQPSRLNPIREQILAALQAEVTVPDRDLGKYVDRERVTDLETARGMAQRRARGRVVHGIKARACRDQFATHPGRNLDGNLVLTRRGRTVTISRVEVREFEDGNSCVEVWTGGTGGEPQFRIFNPPTLVSDPRGDVDLGERGRFREDPLVAVAEVLTGGGR